MKNFEIQLYEIIEIEVGFWAMVCNQLKSRNTRFGW